MHRNSSLQSKNDFRCSLTWNQAALSDGAGNVSRRELTCDTPLGGSDGARINPG